MSLLACAYLSVQYLLAMGTPDFMLGARRRPWSEVALLVGIGDDLEEIAIALFAVQLGCAAAVVSLAYRTRAGG